MNKIENMEFPPYIYHLVTPEVQWKASVFIIMCEDVLGIQYAHLETLDIKS